MGAALYDFHKNGKAGKLIVHSSMFDDDEIPVADLFRKFDKMPALEQKALECATGNILDVGAGSGALHFRKWERSALPLTYLSFL